MEIKSHLSEAELAEFVSDVSRGPGTHLEYCDSCLVEVTRLRKAVAAMRVVEAEDAEFWMRQRDAIWKGIAAAQRQRMPALPRLAWAGALVIVATMGLLLGDGTKSASIPPRHLPPADPDHELLVLMEQVMRSNGPLALEPAAYLVREIRQDERSRTTFSPRTKEKQHED